MVFPLTNKYSIDNLKTALNKHITLEEVKTLDNKHISTNYIDSYTSLLENTNYYKCLLCTKKLKSTIIFTEDYQKKKE